MRFGFTAFEANRYDGANNMALEALSLIKGEKRDRTAYQIISSFMGRITSHLKGSGLATARTWPF